MDNKEYGIILENVFFKSFEEACKSRGLTESAVAGRLAKGDSLEKAFGLPIRNRIPITVEEGKTFETIELAATYYILRSSKVRTRINKLSWSIEKAFELENFYKKYANVTIRGKFFKHIIVAAEYYDLDYYFIARRIRCGYSIEKAFEESFHKKAFEESLLKK